MLKDLLVLRPIGPGMGGEHQQLCRQCRRSLGEEDIEEEGEEEEEKDVEKEEEDEAAAKKQRKRREDMRVYATMVMIVAVAAVVTLAKVLLEGYFKDGRGRAEDDYSDGSETTTGTT